MSELSPALVEQAVSAAMHARSHAYSPYSRFAVGAAIVTRSETIFPGCNVENASYSLTTCAERVAVQNAIALGHRDFALLVICTPRAVAPCGACRQVLAEFSPTLELLLVDADDPTVRNRTCLTELLPRSFSASDLPNRDVPPLTQPS